MAAGWRALLTQAQHVARVYLDPVAEDYLLRLLARAVGSPGGLASDAQAFIGRLAARTAPLQAIVAVGDESLLFGGLFPEQAIRKGIPITYFVQVGINAYREYATMQRDPVAHDLYSMLASDFVELMDVLHTLRDLEQSGPCLDAMNAYQLWRDTGSTHAWRVLRRFTSGSPSLHHTDTRH